MADAVRSEALTDELAAARQEPTSDGLVLMGTALHASALMAAFGALCRHFRNQPGLFITTHLPLCHDPHDLRRHVIPDPRGASRTVPPPQEGMSRPGQGTLRGELAAWSASLNARQCRVAWQMTVDDARCKLKSVYPKIRL